MTCSLPPTIKTSRGCRSGQRDRNNAVRPGNPGPGNFSPLGLPARFAYPVHVLTDIKSLTRDELEAQFKTWDQPVYRVTQLLEWLYVRRATAWDAMTNLPKKLRAQLSENYSLQALELVRKQGSRDITQKFLWKLADGAFIESVLIPANPALYGEASDRHTLCVSTQVGCAYGCKFCASGLDGWKRHLAPNEIVEQVLAVERWNVSEHKTQVAERIVNNI